MLTRFALLSGFVLVVGGSLMAQAPQAPQGPPKGLPIPTPAEAAIIADLKAFEVKYDEAVVKGDVAALERMCAPDFLMAHGDKWTKGMPPVRVDNKTTWIEDMSKAPYAYRHLDSVQVELHGDVAITMGRYRYVMKTTKPNTGHSYVWFERVWTKKTGQWQLMSQRTVNGPNHEDDEPGPATK